MRANVSGRLRRWDCPRSRERRGSSCGTPGRAAPPRGGSSRPSWGRPGTAGRSGLSRNASSSLSAAGIRSSSSTQTPQPAFSLRSWVVTPSVKRWSARVRAASSSLNVPIWRNVTFLKPWRQAARSDLLAPVFLEDAARHRNYPRYQNPTGIAYPSWQPPGMSAAKKVAAGHEFGRFGRLGMLRLGVLQGSIVRSTLQKCVGSPCREHANDHGTARGLCLCAGGDPDLQPRPRGGGPAGQGGRAGVW